MDLYKYLQMMNKLYYLIVFHCVNIILQKYEKKIFNQIFFAKLFHEMKIKNHLNMIDSTNQQFIKDLFLFS